MLTIFWRVCCRRTAGADRGSGQSGDGADELDGRTRSKKTRRVKPLGPRRVAAVHVQTTPAQFDDERPGRVAAARRERKDERQGPRRAFRRSRRPRRSRRRRFRPTVANSRRPAVTDPFLPRRRAFTTPPRSTTPAASASSPTCTTASRTTSCEKGLQILLNLDHRGAIGADAEARRRLRHARRRSRIASSREECAELGFALPAPGHYAIGQFFMPRDPEARAAGRNDHRGGRSPRRARRCSAGATCRSTTPTSARGSRRPSRRSARCSSAAARDVADEDDVRAQAVHPAQGRLQPHLRRSAATASPNIIPSRCRAAPSSTRAWCWSVSSRLLRGLARPALRDRAGARAPALRDQHLPVLAARPSLPDGRPQRRDQHAARQRQLDGGAPGSVDFRAVRRRHLQAVADLLRRPVGHRLFRQCARIPGAAAAIR